MATETRYLYSDEDLGREANRVKELIVQKMVRNELLTDDAATEFLKTHAVVVVKKGFLGSFVDIALGLKNKDDKQYQIIKLA